MTNIYEFRRRPPREPEPPREPSFKAIMITGAVACLIAFGVVVGAVVAGLFFIVGYMILWVRGFMRGYNQAEEERRAREHEP